MKTYFEYYFISCMILIFFNVYMIIKFAFLHERVKKLEEDSKVNKIKNVNDITEKTLKLI